MKNLGLKLYNGCKHFPEYFNDMENIYENIDEFNPNKKHKILIVLHCIIVDMLSKNNIIQQ